MLVSKRREDWRRRSLQVTPLPHLDWGDSDCNLTQNPTSDSLRWWRILLSSLFVLLLPSHHGPGIRGPEWIKMSIHSDQPPAMRLTSSSSGCSECMANFSYLYFSSVLCFILQWGIAMVSSVSFWWGGRVSAAGCVKREVRLTSGQKSRCEFWESRVPFWYLVRWSCGCVPPR